MVGAFNAIWHSGLIWKLIKSKIPPSYVFLIRSYLLDRRLFVPIDELRNVTRNLDKSAPQGAVLSCVLFSIFVNDLIKELKLKGVDV